MLKDTLFYNDTQKRTDYEKIDDVGDGAHLDSGV